MVTRNFFKCFISSPGDCSSERDICENVIDELNKGLAKHLDVNFESFTWEYDVLPDMGINGQEIIDEYIEKSDYDIFIGIMKNRYGRATKKAGSGTEHEFNDALEKKTKNNSGAPQILFFFGKDEVDIDDPNIDKVIEQRKKVTVFKNKIGNEGLYIDFKDSDDFSTLLKQKLELFVKNNSSLEKPDKKFEEVDIILNKLEKDLNESLKSYNEQSPIWIEPIISSKREVPNNPTKNDEHRIDIDALVDNPNNIIIKAPSEFGLTSLAHYMKKKAWKNGKRFLYIDSRQTKKHKVVKNIQYEANEYYFKSANELDCILLDSVCFEENGTMQMIKNICDAYEDLPLVIFNTMDNNFFLKSQEDDSVQIKRRFESYYLLPLPQNELRKIVVSYTKLKVIEEDSDIMLNKVTDDLETLNMHRTVKNCISILRASSMIGSEYSPINRTKLLETILNSIFHDYDMPTYHNKKPDVKDCGFVLGFLCELLVVRNDFEFTDKYFKENLSQFCSDNFIDLDLNYLLNALKDNSIIAKKDTNINYFRNTYWVFFFIAQRMYMSKNFCDLVFKNQTYVDYPEILEFYTGIDRNREDALTILNKDLNETLNIVRQKVNIPDNLNPYKSISWNPDIESLEKEEAKIGENVISSGLPDEVKDKYEDKQYNQIRPYNQVINSVIKDYSFLVLMKHISATSRALRNSDYVNNPKLKKELLNKITQGWNEINKLLIVLSPLLADKGEITFEGASFYLDENDFDIDNPSDKRLAVLLSIPTNIVKIFKNDLFSAKMGPLLIAQANKEANTLIKHQLMLLIIAERPKKWREVIDNYIVFLDKNSFFLSDVLHTLKFNIDYKATEVEDIQILKLLSKKCRAKHLFKSDNPDIGLIKRLDKYDRGSKF